MTGYETYDLYESLRLLEARVAALENQLDALPRELSLLLRYRWPVPPPGKEAPTCQSSEPADPSAPTA